MSVVRLALLLAMLMIGAGASAQPASGQDPRAQVAGRPAPAAAPLALNIDPDLGPAGNVKAPLVNDKDLWLYLCIFSWILTAFFAAGIWRIGVRNRVLARSNMQFESINNMLEQRIGESIAELDKQAAQLIEMATHDALTGLINRGQLMLLLHHVLQRAERYGRIVVVMVIDLDGFKAINETYGNAAGDEVLQAVAARVQRHIRLEDSMARLGSDEFVILMDEVDSKEGAVRVAETVLREVATIASDAGYEIETTCSIGIASVQGWVGASHSADTLLSQADQAMSHAKQTGRGSFRFSKNIAWNATVI